MKTVIANWKMQVGVRESVALARGTLLTLRGRRVSPEVVICPPFVALSEVRKVVARSSVALGAQNMSWEASGAFTGEVSSRMLSELSVSHVIIGHSERRELLMEGDEMIQKKVRQALSAGLIPVICVSALEQVQSALEGISLRSGDQVFIAYEPLEAIGSGNPASVESVVEMFGQIRGVLDAMFGTSSAFRLLYGGSVTGENAYGFLREPSVDGVLVGGASVKINQFKEVVSAAAEVIEAQQ